MDHAHIMGCAKTLRGIMSDPFIGEIQAFPYGYCPYGWLPCDGRALPIRSNEALFSLIGVTYGGDGKNTFKLPNLIGRVVMSQGQGPALTKRTFGSTVGDETVTLTIDQMPAHQHDLQLGNRNAPNATPGPSTTSDVVIDPAFSGFVSPPANTELAPSMAPTGTNAAHPNAQPTLALIYGIAVNGEYPNFG